MWPKMNKAQSVSLYKIIRDHGHPHGITKALMSPAIIVDLGYVKLGIEANGLIHS